MIFPVAPPPIYWTPAWAGPVFASSHHALKTAHGTFRVPEPDPSVPVKAQTDVWIGLGGISHSANLCQAGITFQQTDSGLVGYLFAWDYPHRGRDRKGVRPGDVISVTTGWLGTRWGAIAKDRRTGETVTIGCAAPQNGGWNHAEWVVENHVWDDMVPWLPISPVWFRGIDVTVRRRESGHWERAWWPGTVTRLANGWSLVEVPAIHGATH